MTQLTTGTITELGASNGVAVSAGKFNLLVVITGGAQVELQRSFDAGSTWYTVTHNGNGHPVEFSRTTNRAYEEIESGVQYRLNTVYLGEGSTVQYRIGQ